MLILSSCSEPSTQQIETAKQRLADLELQYDNCKDALFLGQMDEALLSYDAVWRYARSIDQDDMYVKVDKTSVLSRATLLLLELQQHIDARIHEEIVESLLNGQAEISQIDRLMLRTDSKKWKTERVKVIDTLKLHAERSWLVSFTGDPLPQEVRLACLEGIAKAAGDANAYDGFPGLNESMPDGCGSIQVTTKVVEANGAMDGLLLALASKAWEEPIMVSLCIADAEPISSRISYFQQHAEALATQLKQHAESWPKLPDCRLESENK